MTFALVYFNSIQATTIVAKMKVPEILVYILNKNKAN